MFNSREVKFFEFAKNLSATSNHHLARIGAIIVEGNKHILTVGINSKKTHCVQEYYDRYRNFMYPEFCPHHIHAEMSCIIKLKNIYVDYFDKKLSIYVSRLMKNNNLGNCRPCPACMKAIKDVGIRDIYYTTNDGFCYENIR